MTFVYNRGNPDNLVAGAPAAMDDVQGPFYDLRDYLNGPAVTKPSIVAALPSTPADGDEIYFLADAATGVVWHLRYRSTSPSPYKWEFLGGPPLISEVVAAEAAVGNSSGAYGDGATVGPSVAVPLGGDFHYDYGCSFYGETGIPQFKVSVQFGATAATDFDAAIWIPPGPSGTWPWVPLYRSTRKTARPAETVTVKMYRFGIANPQFRSRYLMVEPVRVG